MSEKYYIVSESELEAYANARASRDLSIGKEGQYEMDRLCSILKAAYVACRARHVNLYGPIFPGSTDIIWMESKMKGDV